MPDLSYAHIRGLALFQEIFRYKRKAVHAVNEKLRTIREILVSAVNNITHNYSNRVITQENYRDYMKKAQHVQDAYEKLRGPHTIRSLTSDLRIKVAHLHYITTELIKTCGCCSCYDIMNMLIGCNWDMLFTENQRKQLHEYNTMFVPVSFRIEQSEASDRPVLVVNRYNAYTHSYLLKLHGAEIVIPYGGNAIIMRGYFRDDSLNISRKGGILEQKYRNLLDSVNDTIFHQRYIEQIHLCDFMCNNTEGLLVQVERDEKEHTRLRELPIGHVAEEFHSSPLTKQHHILSLLLSDPVTYPHAKSIIAILLQDPEGRLSNIYRLLHWSVQGYFDEVARSVDQKNISDDENTIPYETRIESMKCSESTKRKARDRLKEIRVAREGNDKAIKYLDGILQIPFGRYQRERILRFITDHRNELCEIANIAGEHMDNEDLKYIRNVISGMKSEDQIDNGWSKLGDISRTAETDLHRGVIDQLDRLATEWRGFKIARKEYLKTVQMTLNCCIYGQDDAKRKIESLIAQWINGEMSGCVFGFQGYPGTGKTTFAKQGLAKCLIDDNGQSRPFFFIPLGGSHGGSMLEGHGYTYVGSHWGAIADCLREGRVMNPIIYFDELDKVSGTPRGEEIIRILTHLTDPEQNDAIIDRYFNCELDLSKALIIFSYNDRKNIDEILMDRIYEIHFSQYTKGEKVRIVQDYMLGKILQAAGYAPGSMVFSDKILEYLIESYTVEAGVRDLKDKITEIVREVNLRRIHDETITLPIHISEAMIDDILKRRNKITITDIPKVSQIGWVNGLYATSIGTGGVTVIQVFETPSDQKFHLELTGKLGDVMKESVRCAKTIGWRMFRGADRTAIETRWRENALHIHFPAAGTPKDGPSAGAAITTAIISYFSKLPFRNYIAMTGEIDLHGNIKMIGGLQCKIEGAQRAGARIVLIPRGNESEWVEIEGASVYKVYVIAVDNISQIIRTCLLGATAETFDYAMPDIDNDDTVIRILTAIKLCETALADVKLL